MIEQKKRKVLNMMIFKTVLNFIYYKYLIINNSKFENINK